MCLTLLAALLSGALVVIARGRGRASHGGERPGAVVAGAYFVAAL